VKTSFCDSWKKGSGAVQIKYDPVIMQELLDHPEIRPQVEQMTPEMKEWFIELLVRQGIYARYLKEREAE
jgi:hypothetical protein